MTLTSSSTRARVAASGIVAALAAALTFSAVSPAQAAAPVGDHDAYTVTRDTVLDVTAPGLWANDSDPEGDALQYQSVWPPAGGPLPGESLDVGANGGQGGFAYTPPTGFTGERTWGYYLNDGAEVSGLINVTFTIEPPASNVLPVAGDDSYAVAQSTTLTVAVPGVLGNDSDPDGDPISVTGVTAATPSLGGESLTLLPDGSFEYIPAPGFLGTRQFGYSVTDGQGDSEPAALTFVVAVPGAQNTPPVAVADAFDVIEDTALPVGAPGLFANDYDQDGDTFSFKAIVQPVLNALPGESLVLSPDLGGFTYTPPTGFTGVRVWSYSIQGDDGESDIVDITFTIDPLGAPPVSTPDNYVVLQDTTLNTAAPGLLANDSDPEGDPIFVAMATEPIGGTLPGEALTWNSDGSFQYAPPTGFTGLRTWQYQANDGTQGGIPVSVVFDVVADAPNAAPVAVADTYAATAGTPLIVGLPGVLGNDSDADGDTVMVTGWDAPAGGLLAGEDFGLNPNGTFEYVAPAGYSGTRVFAYRVTDGALDSGDATLTFTVGAPAANTVPIAQPDAYAVTAGTPLVVGAPGVLGNDTDADGDALSVSQVFAPAGGALFGESLVVAADGSLEYTAPSGFTGIRTWRYEATDGTDPADYVDVRFTIAPPAAPQPELGTEAQEAPAGESLAATGDDSAPLVAVLAALLLAIGASFVRSSRRAS